MSRLLLPLALTCLFACGYAQAPVDPGGDDPADAGGNADAGDDAGNGGNTDSGNGNTDAGNGGTDGGGNDGDGGVDGGADAGGPPPVCALGATRGCYTYGSGTTDPTIGQGVCQAGTQTCTSVGGGRTAWGSCQNEVTPSTEVCGDSDDDDCDGINDNGACSTTFAMEGPFAGGVFGNSSGTLFNRSCPDGGVVRGIYTWSGANLDWIELECGTIAMQESTTSPGTFNFLVSGSSWTPGVGGPGGDENPEYHCPSNSVVARAEWYEHNSRIDGIRLTCATIKATLQSDGGFVMSRTLQAMGGLQGDNDITIEHDKDCGSASEPMVLSGMNIRADDFIRSIGLICSRPVVTRQ